MEAVRGRLKTRVAQRFGGSARQLAHLTGDDEKNVQRWVSGQSKTIPADFIGRCEAKGFASARWLLTGDGPPEPHKPGEAESIVQAVGLVLGGKVDPADVIELATVGAEDRERLRALYRRAQELGELPGPGPGEARPDTV